MKPLILNKENYVSISQEIAKEYCYDNLPLVPVCNSCMVSFGDIKETIKVLEKWALNNYIKSLKESKFKEHWDTYCFLVARPFDYSTVIRRKSFTFPRIKWCKEQGIKRDGYQICINCFRKNNRSELKVKKAIETKILIK